MIDCLMKLCIPAFPSAMLGSVRCVRVTLRGHSSPDTGRCPGVTEHRRCSSQELHSPAAPRAHLELRGHIWSSEPGWSELAESCHSFISFIGGKKEKFQCLSKGELAESCQRFIGTKYPIVFLGVSKGGVPAHGGGIGTGLEL